MKRNLKKRLLITALTAAMIVQSLSMPVLVAQADSVNEELSIETFSETQTGEPGEDQSDAIPDEEPKEGQPEEETPDEPTDEGAEEDPDGEQPDDTPEKQPGDETGESEKETLGEETTDGDSEAEQPNDEIDGQTSEPEENRADDLSVELEVEYVDVSDGVYQAGAFSVFGESADSKYAPYSVMPNATASEEAAEYIYQQLLARETEIYISEYNILEKDIGAIFSGVVNDHPDLYYVKTGFGYSYSGTIVTRIRPIYIDGLDDAAFRAGLQDALSVVKPGMTELEKAVALHDYLVINCEYDKINLDANTIPDVSYSAYGVLADGVAVCQGYALAYKLLLNKVGIECYMVTSGKEAMNHAWNLIVLNGEYYQVDVTWDDPTWDMTGRAVHTYMFRSDAEFWELDHYGWEVTSGSEVVDYKATDTRYDSAFWLKCRSPLVLTEDGCYYVAYENSSAYIKKKESLDDITDTGDLVLNIGKWPVWGGGGSWQGAYSGLFQMDGRLYYNDTTSIYSIAPDGSDQHTEFTADTTDGYVYGSALSRGKVLYCLRQDPNYKGKETVLVADITVSGGSGSGGQGDGDQGDGDQDDEGLDLANYTAEYTTIDDTIISSVAQGRPKLLIFYRNTCWNSQQTISSISRNIEDFGGADVYAIEIDGNSKESVAEFQETYGCDEIVFSYDTGTSNSASMWQYVRAGGVTNDDGSVTLPVVCYIDADNRLQYVTTGYNTADVVLSNLKKYCGYTYQKPEMYTITYVLYGGTNDSENPSAYTPQTDTIILRDAIRDGYQFGGWYRETSYLTRVTQIAKGSSGNITLYAKWISETGSDLPTVDITPSASNVVMGFSGSYYTESADKILKRLNEIRLEACKEGVINPDTGQPLTMGNYVPLKWSSDLEAIARLRAAEATVNQAHTRPNGTNCFTVTTSNNEQSWAENLAWNYSGLMAGIEQWYNEKADWVNKTGKTTGHYTSIISPGYNYVAVGAFRLTSGGWYAVAQEFSYKNSLDEQKNSEQGKCIQYMEVQGSKVSKFAFDSNQASAFREGDTYQLSLDVTVKYADYYGTSQSHTGPYQAGGNWTSSDRNVLTVDNMGFITAKAKGVATVSVSAGSTSTSKDIMVYGKDESPIMIQPPTVTTYKVGQAIDLKGGKVTYVSGSTTKTEDIKSGMISGFDSTRPGICKVNVTCGGYVASFDTLIVEEPKLTALYGQKLADVAFPSNDYGTYTWVGGTQILDTVGVQTFDAVYTPLNGNAFQKLTDLKIQVTVQAGLGDSTDVSFKNSRFVYNGTEQEPKVVVSIGDNILVEGQDYTLSYQHNINAGDAVVIIEGINTYFGSISRTFKIDPAQLTITAKDIGLLIGEPIPETYDYVVRELESDDKLLTKPSFRCDVEYEENESGEKVTKVGRYDIVPYGADAGANYEITYVSGRLTVASEYVSCTVSFDVQGRGTAPADYVGIIVGSTIVRPAPNPLAEGYRFDGWYQDAACTKAWNFDTDIVQSKITLYAKWLKKSEEGSFALQEIADVYYTGNACKPAVSVYDGETLLKAGKDYQIKYYNNTNANKDNVLKEGDGEGEYFNPALPYVEITGKGNYTEVVKVNFNILQASIGDGSEDPASGIALKVSDQLVTANKVQKPFSSIKYVKSMKQGIDYTLTLTVVNARDKSGKGLQKDSVLENASIPAGYEGEFLLTVHGEGNYEGSVSKRIHVTDKSHLIKNAVITLGKNLKNIEYPGGEVKLIPSEENSADTFTVKCGNAFLKYNKDYTVSYRNNDRVGKAELIITGMGEYVGSKMVTFNIKGKAFTTKKVKVEGIADKVYTGRAWTQNGVALTYGEGTEEEKALKYGTDYTISYSKNINKGTATMTIKGVDAAGYSGSFKKTFKITAQDISDESKVIQLAGMKNITVGYTKAGAKPVDEIVLKNSEGFPLSNGKDYTLKYTNNKSVASTADEKPPTITVKGKGNYAGELKVYFTITKGDLDWSIEGTDITVKTSSVGYQMNKAADYAYKPSVKLMDGKTALRAGVDYNIEYVQNTQADYDAFMQKLKDDEAYTQKLENGIVSYDGVPRAVITEKEGSSYELSSPKYVLLPIYQTKLTKSNLTVEIGEAVYTGSQARPKVTVYYQGEGGPVPLTENKDYSISYGANIQSGKNKGSVTISGIAPYYGGDVTVKFEIVRKPISY